MYNPNRDEYTYVTQKKYFVGFYRNDIGEDMHVT